MMRLLMGLILALGLTQLAVAQNVSGVNVADKFMAGQSELLLNGAGTRNKFFVDMYVGALYLPTINNDAEAVIAADETMAIRLHIVSGIINPKLMSDSTRDGFVRSTKGNIAPIEDDIEELISAFQDAVEEGDVFDLVYTPDTGVTVYRNGEKKSNVIGLAFKQALFGIWLSKDPIQDSMKDDMLNI